MPLSAIVFDFDGVIANTEPLHLAGFRDVLAAEGIVLSERDYYDRYLGYDDEAAFRAIAGDHGHDWAAAHVQMLVARKAERLEELSAMTSVLFPGAADAVRRAAEAVPIAIASGALRQEILRTLRREGLDHFFSAIVAAEDAASKPSPDPYVAAVARLREATSSALPLHECVAIEDSHWGLESARAAGLRTVAVAHTYAAADLAADLVISQIGDLDISRLRIACRSVGQFSSPNPTA